MKKPKKKLRSLNDVENSSFELKSEWWDKKSILGTKRCQKSIIVSTVSFFIQIC